MDEWQAELERLEAEQSRGVIARLARLPRRYFYAGIGALSLAAEKIEEFRYEKVERNIDRLEERGHSLKERRLQDLSDTVEMGRDLAMGLAQQSVGKALAPFAGVASTARERLGIAGAAELDAVARQLDELDQRLETIPVD
ncbi:phasin family protein [Promineifilum sp.]|uniref:phasin family protein n=1 Tax=Promineifilum sp. TaxID=2664178 RepID=UPI0035B1F804